jgi:hypothetical protein
MIGTLLIALTVFISMYISASSELPSIDSGPNFAISSIMILVLLVLSSFTALTVTISDDNLKIKFGYGIFRKSLALGDIASVKTVKNKWYYGWGIRTWIWPYMRIYNVSGLDAVEIVLKNGKIYRVGTDDPQGLEIALNKAVYGFSH